MIKNPIKVIKAKMQDLAQNMQRVLYFLYADKIRQIEEDEKLASVQSCMTAEQDAIAAQNAELEEGYEIESI